MKVKVSSLKGKICARGNKITPCISNAGCYLGTLDNGMPNCRLSGEYFQRTMDLEESVITLVRTCPNCNAMELAGEIEGSVGNKLLGLNLDIDLIAEMETEIDLVKHSISGVNEFIDIVNLEKLF